MSMSLLNIKHREAESLLYSVRNVRITTFWTPSSFYLQLPDEDEWYNNLEMEMLEFYNGVSIYAYCCNLNGQTPNNKSLNKLKIQHLKSKMNITTKVAGKWVRCVTSVIPHECKNIDTGALYKLSPAMEKSGIYELDIQFLSLPPRALLCGLSGIIPNAPDGRRWSSRACTIFKSLTTGWPLRVYFNQSGLLSNSYYVFLSATAKEGYSVHINTCLCAFDAAIADTESLHHPIWPSDTPA